MYVCIYLSIHSSTRNRGAVGFVRALPASLRCVLEHTFECEGMMLKQPPPPPPPPKKKKKKKMGVQWLSGRVLDSRPRGHRFEPHRRHCVVSLSKNITPSLVLVGPMKNHPFITERLLMGGEEPNQPTNQPKNQ